MTRPSFTLLCVLLGAVTVGGVVLALPTPAELGWIEHEMTCAEWFEADEPPTGSVRLTECAIAPTVRPESRPRSARVVRRTGLEVAELAAEVSMDARGIESAAVTLWPPEVDHDFVDENAFERRLIFVTEDAELRRLADAFDRNTRSWALDDDPMDGRYQDRFRARHERTLRQPRTVQGVLEPVTDDDYGAHARLVRDGTAYVLGRSERRRALRFSSVALATLAGLALLWLVTRQRRWTRRREELLSGRSGPLTF